MIKNTLRTRCPAAFAAALCPLVAVGNLAPPALGKSPVQAHSQAREVQPLVQHADPMIGVRGARQNVPASASNVWYSLNGNPVAAGNPIGDDGLIHKVSSPVLRVTRTSVPKPQGSILLFPGGGYSVLSALNEGSRTAEILNGFGYDVVMLEYHTNSGEETRDLALKDALRAWKLLKNRPDALGVRGGRLGLMGYSAGGHLAARVEESLAARAPGQEPDDLILVYPAYLDENAPGSNEPMVKPPPHPRTRLTALMAQDDNPAWLKGCQRYVDAWKNAGGGDAKFFQFKTGGHGFGVQPNLTGEIQEWPSILGYFLENGPKPGVGPFSDALPWFIGHQKDRLADFTRDKRVDHGHYVFLGDSITEKWSLPQAFPNLKIANRGIAGDTTRGMLCRLQDNVIDLNPKSVVFMGGINDLFQGGTPETISVNVDSILQQLHNAIPNTPVYVCEILPSQGIKNEIVSAANAAVDKVVQKYPNAHRVRTYRPYLNADGSQNTSLFEDGTHPNAAGYAIWQGILKPLP